MGPLFIYWFVYLSISLSFVYLFVPLCPFCPCFVYLLVRWSLVGPLHYTSTYLCASSPTHLLTSFTYSHLHRLVYPPPPPPPTPPSINLSIPLFVYRIRLYIYRMNKTLRDTPHEQVTRQKCPCLI